VDRVGVAFTGGLVPSDIVASVKLAEELGYDSAWIAEGHGGDQFAILAACAMATSRIRLGTSISSVFVRSAPTIAMAAATVDQLSGGRFVLGLGSSHRVQVEGEHGLPYARPIERVRETVEVVRVLLRAGAVSYRGGVIDIAQFDLWFRPLRPAVPIYLSGLFRPMLEVCGEVAQGVILTWSTLDFARTAAAHVATGAERVGRQAADVEIASLLGCAVATDVEEARRRLKPGVALYAGYFPRYNRLLAESGFADAAAAIRAAWARGDREGAARLVPDALVDAMTLAGPPARCRERLAQYRAAGVGLPIVTPRVRGGGGVAAVKEVLLACAPPRAS
jgi:alkanesulfonate monooxygenase SsuD/methylene tetrahydromethanopterin reductase-like flavin-dependent oxidoreductase (luciferase family)